MKPKCRKLEVPIPKAVVKSGSTNITGDDIEGDDSAKSDNESKKKSSSYLLYK